LAAGDLDILSGGNNLFLSQDRVCFH